MIACGIRVPLYQTLKSESRILQHALYRVATKQMTYVKQLEDYEEQVMQKRLEEMPEAELEALMKDIEEKKQQRRR